MNAPDSSLHQLIIAEDEEFLPEGRPRIVFDSASGTVRFEYCHHPRTFLSAGAEPLRVCRLEEITAVSDFLSGEHQGRAIKAVLAAGPLVHSHSTAADLASYFISTRSGRCRVFAHWRNFTELRQALAAIVPEGSRPHWSEDPRMVPLFAAALIVAVCGLIYLLL